MSHLPPDELLTEFVDESIQSLRDLPQDLQRYSEQPSETELIHRVFRAVHSLKGSAGFFGLTEIKKFAHRLENILDQLRQRAISPTPDLCRTIIAGIDHLEHWLQTHPQGEGDLADQQFRERILSQIEQHASESSGSDATRTLQLIDDLLQEMNESTASPAKSWTEKLRRIRGHFDVGEAAALPPAPAITIAGLQGARFASGGEDLTPLVSPLFPLFVETENGRYSSNLADDFLAALDDLATWCEIHQQQGLRERLAEARNQLRTLLAGPIPIDSLLLSIVWETLAPALQELKAPIDERKAEHVGSAPPAKAEGQPAKSGSHFIRIREERIETFMNDVSRLFITSERIRDFQRRSALELKESALTDELREISAALTVQVSELQKSVCALRKVPVSTLFSKFPSVARTLAESLGKKLRVHLSGEQLEIDKALVDDLEAPITHMIRNVCDHAIETPEARLARGVSAEGNLHLECELLKSHVQIRIRDDGRGIDPHRLRAKAIEKQILTPEDAARLTDQEAIDLIFHAGFSTAENVSEVSGRGVGMDVVRTNVMAHGGTVRVESVVNQGTTFYLEIPNRQAVLVVEGILVAESGGRFVAPFDHVSEIISIEEHSCATVQGEDFVVVRDMPIPAARLADLLGLPCDREPIAGKHGLVLHHRRSMLCLVIDRVLGQRKVVVNPIQSMLPTVHQIGGVAQLGGGEMALVLNVGELIESQVNRAARFSAATC